MTSKTTSSNLNAYANAFASAGTIVQGENGENKLRESQSPFVDCFTKWVRGTTREEIDLGIQNMITAANLRHVMTEAGYFVKDIFVLAFHKRQNRHDGEGEHDIFYHIILSMYDRYPETVCSIIRSGLIEEYGYFKDYFNIWKQICVVEGAKVGAGQVTMFYDKYDMLIRTIRETILTQRRKDLNALFKFLSSHAKKPSEATVENVSEFIDSLRKDGPYLPKISLLAKFIPKEGRSFAKSLFWYVPIGDGSIKRETLIPFIVRGSLKMKNRETGEMVGFPRTQNVPYGALRNYRKENSLLGAFLDVTEQKMCRGDFHKIDHERVASICGRKNSKAFLNEQRKKAPTPYEEETGNRYPNKPERVECRKNLRNLFTDPDKINVSQDQPHQIAYNAFISKSTADRDLQCARWTAFVNQMRTKLDESRQKMAEEFEAQAKSSGNDMTDAVRKAILSGNIIGCADMLGSMTWDNTPPNRPYDVAIGLTALMSEVSAPAWRDLALGFSDNPSVFSFNTYGRSMNIVERMNEIARHEGYSTNIEAMHDEIIRVMKSAGLTDDAMPVIVIFTDGEWNEQIKGDASMTGHQKTEANYARNGFKTMPTIVYWNLKPGRNGVQTSQDHPGVQFLQGQSPGLFKYVLFGETCEMVEKTVMVEGQEVTMKTSAVTPYDTFRKAMDQECYYPLLHVLSNSNEEYLYYYRFVEPLYSDSEPECVD